MLVAFCASLLAGGAGTAMAEDWQCRALRLEIANAPRGGGGGNGAQAARYAKAISAQQGQIAKAKAQMRAVGCRSGGSDAAAAACRKLDGALRAMNANMSKLRSQHARLSSGGGGGQRAVLQARYRAMGCGSNDDSLNTLIARSEQRPNDGIEAIYGEQKQRQRVAIPGLSYGGNTFRTLCVRTCDGYYFPVSFSTTRENFGRDLKACETMCPGTEVRLFMHNVPEEESEDMKDEKGEPYKAMSYAFAYRRDGVSSNPSCKCNAVQGMGYAALPQPAAEDRPDKGDKDAPWPTPKPDPLLDRESIADMAGNFTTDELRRLLRPETARAPSNTTVRIVGPVFLPDPSGAAGLRAPAPPVVR